MNPPGLDWILTARVSVGPRRDMGAWQGGQRYIVDILGGSFEGPTLKGTVRPGGADRQWLRPDGVKELDALYELETDTGSLITVRNRVLIDDAAPGGRYARSVVRLTVPQGPLDWLNRRVLVGDLLSFQPAQPAVQVRFFALT